MDSTGRILLLQIFCMGFMSWICAANGIGTVTVHSSAGHAHSMTVTTTTAQNKTTVHLHNTTVHPTKHHNSTVHPRNTTVHPTKHHNSTVHPRNTTVHPTKHHNSTVHPRNTTVHPTKHHNSTVHPCNTTVHPTKHHNSTVHPRNTTVHPTKHHNSTVHPRNTTVHPTKHHNSTVHPRNTTVHPTKHHNSTVHPTKHHKTTVYPHNTTIVPAGNTTAVTHFIKPTSTQAVVSSSSAIVPTVTPLPALHKFNVTNKKGEVCLLAYLEVEFKVIYTDRNKTEVQVNLTLPSDAFVQGKCDSNKVPPYITLAWPKAKPFYLFSMKFNKSKSESGLNAKPEMWTISDLSLEVDTKGNPKFANYNGTKFQVEATEVKQLGAPVGDAYKCLNQHIEVPLSGAQEKATVQFDGIIVQPYGVPHNGSFSHAEVCSSATTSPHTGKPSAGKSTGESHVVPIAVGCTLAGLVILVLIGYVIARRRKRGPKYSKL